MSKLSFKELRESIDSDKIKSIIKTRYGVDHYYESDDFIIFPTICHNLSGGSNKLYYYKDTHLFKCYTGCSSMFDIFDLIVKAEDLRGNMIGTYQSVMITGANVSDFQREQLKDQHALKGLEKMYIIKSFRDYTADDTVLKTIDKKVLKKYIFDMNALEMWRREGISSLSMWNYQIAYDVTENCIIVPHHDINGEIVGVRGRYLSENAYAKYKPVSYNGELLNHPTSLNLYGIAFNKKAITNTRTCVLFEGEKSVLKMDTIYGDENISLAVCGQTISERHVQLLRDLKVSNLIIAFDADHTNYEEMKEIEKKYTKLARPLSIYFNVSIIMDYSGLLEYKDSPIDKGERVFEELLKNKIYIK